MSKTSDVGPVAQQTTQHLGRREFVGLGLGAFVVAAIPLAKRRPVGVVHRTMPVMGTIAQFAVVHRDPQEAHAAIDAAMAELLWVERTMTRFTDTSDIGRANLHASREGVFVTPETAHVTNEALRWANALGGRYDPAIGAVCKLWDVKHRHEPPPDARVAELANRRFYSSVEPGVLRGTPVLRYHDAGARLDLGSIAKGFGVDRAIAALRRLDIEKAVVVAGGDLYALGTAPSGDPWSIGIQSPMDERAIVGTIELADRGVATSGTYRQFFRYRGHRYHHIMDPVTAQPRATTMQSLTIAADSVMHADAATTALFGLADADITAHLARNLPDGRLERVIRS